MGIERRIDRYFISRDNQDQIRLATATSEIVRNAFRYAREGTVTFSLALDFPQRLQVTVSDAGHGIQRLEDILEGRYVSETGLGKGMIGTKQLMDDFEVHTSIGGTTVKMGKKIPGHHAWTQERLGKLMGGVAGAVFPGSI